MKDPSEKSLMKNIDEPQCWQYILYNKMVQIFLILILCTFIGIGTPFIWQQIWKINFDCCAIESDLRYDCDPLKPSLNQNETKCKDVAKCCWDPLATSNQIKCYYGIVSENTEKMPGYKIERSDNYESAILKIDRIPLYLDKNNSNPKNGPVFARNLNITVKHYTESHFSIKIAEENSIDYSKYLNTYDWNYLKENKSVDSLANISWRKEIDADFTLSVERKETKKLIFNTGDYSPFIFSKGFIEITTLLPNDLIFGLGQSPSKSFKHNMTFPQEWAIFNKHYLNLTHNQTSWFGSHPFYMGLEGDGKAYGVLLINTHPIQVITNSRPSLTYRTVGGDLDFHFFMGPNPLDVIKQLKKLIRKPSLPPYWALGFHMCRTTCDLNDRINVIKQMRDYSVPLESDCGSSALSAISFRNDFTTLNDFYETIKNTYKMKTIVTHVPQIKKDEEKDSAYERWKQLALKTADNPGSPYNGHFWDWCESSSDLKNSSVLFPSFLDEKEAKRVLTANLETAKFLDIDGYLLNYNTPLDLSFTTKFGNQSFKSVLDKYGWNQFYYSKLNEYSPTLDLVYPGHEEIEHLSLHNLYGYQHMKIMSDVLKERPEPMKKRKLVMSLSTFTGSGYFGGHMGGFMNASWDMLRQTVIQTLEFNMYGIPLTGFPVCGFTGWSNDGELCLRWYQLAALQPFMISHRDYGQKLTDPIALSLDPFKKIDEMALEAIKSALTIRYRLLPYLYTLFFNDNLNGDMVLRPMFAEFPDDSKTYRIDKQYFWGSALMISPVTELGVKSVKAYFPQGNWYEFYSGRRIPNKKGRHLELSAVEYHINLHIRGGYVIPTQRSGNNTVESRQNPFTLVAALDSKDFATGELFIDDGITQIDSKRYLLYNFTVNATKIILEPKNMDWINGTKLGTELDPINTSIDEFKIFGVIDSPYPLLINLTIWQKEKLIREEFFNSTRISHHLSLGVLTLQNLETYLDLSYNHKYVLEWDNRHWDK